jgi:hypothetical protein
MFTSIKNKWNSLTAKVSFVLDLVVEWFAHENKTRLAKEVALTTTFFTLLDVVTTWFVLGVPFSSLPLLRVVVASTVVSTLTVFAENFTVWAKNVEANLAEQEDFFDGLVEDQTEADLVEEALKLSPSEWTTAHKVAFARATARANAKPSAVRTATL